jgi:hypothetical protein
MKVWAVFRPIFARNGFHVTQLMAGVSKSVSHRPMALATISPDVVRAIVHLGALTRAVTGTVDGLAKANVAQKMIIHVRDGAQVTGALAAGAEMSNDG